MAIDHVMRKLEYKEPMAAGRLLLMSPFEEKVRRLTVDTALTRNRFVAALADTVLIAHAQPGSKTEQLAQEVVGWGKHVYTLAHPANERLLALGVRNCTKSKAVNSSAIRTPSASTKPRATGAGSGECVLS